MAVPQSTRLIGPRAAIAEHEYYKEPAWAVEALLDAERFIGDTLDPCCGSGTIPDTFNKRGLTAYGSDIVDRAAGRFNVGDFFADGVVEPSVSNIVSNPPFSLLLPFIDRSLIIAQHKVVVLARLAFLETPGRKAFFLSRPLARVLVFSKRVSMPPAGMGIPEKGGTVAFAWFVFEHGHRGPNGQSLPATIGFVP